MPEQSNHIPSYGFADIERYLQGKLSPAEMHELEKAALQDPFLADAIEGYQLGNIADSATDLAEIRKGFSAPAPVIVQQTKRFSWLRIAAMLVVLAGIGMAGWKLLLKPGTAPDTIASVSKSQPQIAAERDSISPNKQKAARLSAESKRQEQLFAANLAKKQADVALQESYNKSLAKEIRAIHDSIVASLQDASGAKDKAAPGTASAASNLVAVVTGFKNVNPDRSVVNSREQSADAGGLSGVASQNSLFVPVNSVDKRKNADTIHVNPDDLKRISAWSAEKSPRLDTRPIAMRIGAANKNQRDPLSVDKTSLADLSSHSPGLRFTANAPAKPVWDSLTFKADSIEFRSSRAYDRAPALDLAMADNNKLKKTAGQPSNTSDLNEVVITKTSPRVAPLIGWPAFSNYLRDKLIESGISLAPAGKNGTIRFKITVNEKGNPTHIEVLETFDGKLNRALIRAIKKGPLWTGNENQKKETAFSVAL